MNKKLIMLLTIFMVSVFTVSGCKKKADNAKKDVKKVAGDVKKVAGDVKAKVKNVAGINFASKLDLSYFPEDAVLVSSVDIKKFLSIEILKPLLKDGLAQAKEMGIDLEKATFASWYMNLEDLNAKKPEVAGFVNNLTIPEALLTKMKIKVEKKSYNGVDLFTSPGTDDGAYATIGNNTLGGSLKAIKKMIDVKKGKLKSLASSPKSKIFKDILAKTGNSALRFAFVPNKLLTDKLSELSKEGQAAMFAEFINNFKAASFGIAITDKAFGFSINVRSSKAGIDMVMGMVKPQLGMLQQDNSPMLAMTERFLGKEGVKMLAAVVKTIKVTNNGEYLSITFETKLEYWKKAPEILGGIMGKM